jgi:ABC-type antimicrobial peptide transport system permease subunit
VLSLALSRGLSALLFGVAATDVATYASIAALLLVVALLSAFGPARRATRIDPISSLRE